VLVLIMGSTTTGGTRTLTNGNNGKLIDLSECVSLWGCWGTLSLFSFLIFILIL